MFEFLSDQRSLNRANYIFASSPQEKNVVISALRSFNLNSDAVKLFADPRYTISCDLKSDYAINNSPYVDIFGEYSLILGSYSIHENPNNVESRDKHFSDVIDWYRGSTRDKKYIEQVWNSISVIVKLIGECSRYLTIKLVCWTRIKIINLYSVLILVLL